MQVCFFVLALLRIIVDEAGCWCLRGDNKRGKRTDWVEGGVQHFSLLWSLRHPKVTTGGTKLYQFYIFASTVAAAFWDGTQIGELRLLLRWKNTYYHIISLWSHQQKVKYIYFFQPARFSPFPCDDHMWAPAGRDKEINNLCCCCFYCAYLLLLTHLRWVDEAVLIWIKTTFLFHIREKSDLHFWNLFRKVVWLNPDLNCFTVVTS